MDYRALLEHSFNFMRDEDICAPESRLDYLSRNIFDFTTYDSSMDELFARKAIEVCDAITNRATFDYINDPDNYQWYLVMCNMPFFASRIEWGGSIRGAWWRHDGIDLKSYMLWSGDRQLVGGLRFADAEEWTKFVRAMAEFASPEMALAV